jgi:glycosyltransferase involved in cell wall biosynthesis
MKIIYIAPYPPEKDGIGTYTKRTVDAFKSEGVDILVVSTYRKEISKEAGAVRLMSYNPILIWKLILFLIKQKSDVIHLQYNIALYGFYSFVLLFALTLTKVLSDSKLVITLHDVKREHDMLKSLSVIFYKCYLVPFDLVYVHTNEACELLVQKHVVPSSKIKLIHHGLTSLVQHSSTESINKKHILFFGYIHIHKGIDDLIKSVEILLRSGRVDKDKIKLIVAGDVRERKGIFKYFGDKDHEYKQSLTKLVNDLKIVQHVEFIGYQETNNLHSLISNSFCVVLPYTNVEQSGVLNIALNFHKPIIATNIGGLKV